MYALDEASRMLLIDHTTFFRHSASALSEGKKSLSVDLWYSESGFFWLVFFASEFIPGTVFNC